MYYVFPTFHSPKLAPYFAEHLHHVSIQAPLKTTPLVFLAGYLSALVYM